MDIVMQNISIISILGQLLYQTRLRGTVNIFGKHMIGNFTSETVNQRLSVYSNIDNLKVDSISLNVVSYRSSHFLLSHISLAAQVVSFYIILPSLIIFAYFLSLLGVQGEQKCYYTRHFSSTTNLSKTYNLIWRFRDTKGEKSCNLCVFLC